MAGLQEYLVELSDRLDKEGKTVCSNAVDDLIKTASMQKLAQYVGVIGYVLKQNRAMCNCIRRKRQASQGSMQDVILQCLKEYQDGQDYHNTEWTSKYAEVIEKTPDRFDVAHLYLLSTIAESAEIKKHTENVRKTAQLLADNNVHEDMFNKLMSHVDTYGELLKKESEHFLPFKLAAPPSQRGWWSRLWTPSDWSLWNPRSWSRSNRERGQDKDTILEMENVLEEISSIDHVVQQMTTGISRLKNEVSGYLARSGEDELLDKIRGKINDLDVDDWNSTAISLQQLQYMLRNQNVQNPYNREILGRTTGLIDQVFRGMTRIYDHIDNIQKQMTNLRQRAPVSGSRSGSNPQVSEEFGALERVLNRLYANPFDQDAHWYAKRLHARLWNVLWPDQQQMPEDELTQQWLAETPKQPSVNIPGPKEDSGQSPQQEKPIDEQKLQDAATQIKGKVSQESLLNFLTAVEISMANDRDKEVIRKLKTMVLPGQSGVGSASAAPSTVDLSSPEDEIQDWNRLCDDEDCRQRGEDKSMPMTSLGGLLVSDIMKIADSIDQTNPDLAQILDNFIKEHRKDNLPDFPSYSVVLKTENEKEITEAGKSVP